MIPTVAAFMVLIPRVKGYTALFGAWFVLSTHEIFWYVTYIVKSITSQEYFTSTVQAGDTLNQFVGTSVQMAQLFGIGAYLILLAYKKDINGKRRIPFQYLTLMIGVYAVWFALGFHIRTGYAGETTWYNDPATNIEEITSWIVAASGFVIFERKDMKKLDGTLNQLIGSKWESLYHKIVNGSHGISQRDSNSKALTDSSITQTIPEHEAFGNRPEDGSPDTSISTGPEEERRNR